MGRARAPRAERRDDPLGAAAPHGRGHQREDAGEHAAHPRGGRIRRPHRLSRGSPARRVCAYGAWRRPSWRTCSRSWAGSPTTPTGSSPADPSEPRCPEVANYAGSVPSTSAALTHAADLAEFVAASPSSFHAASVVARRLQQAGFTPLDETSPWSVTPGAKQLVVRDGAVIAWVVPDTADADTAFRIFGAHSDSPAFKLKPKPTTGRAGWLQAAVEVYGGPLLNSWLDRELRLAGRLALDDGTEVLAATGALLRLPQLAIHLDREANDHLTLDKQIRHSRCGDSATRHTPTSSPKSPRLRTSPRPRMRGYDVVVADAARGAIFGKDRRVLRFGSPGRSGIGARGVVALEVAERTPGAHDRRARRVRPRGIGSASVRARLGPSSRRARAPLLGTWRGPRSALRAASLRRGACLERRRPLGAPQLRREARSRGAAGARLGADPEDQREPALCDGCDRRGLVANLVRRAERSRPGVRVEQRVPCGSTIGPITATRLGIRTVDVGIPILSMHSARELAGSADLDRPATAPPLLRRLTRRSPPGRVETSSGVRLRSLAEQPARAESKRGAARFDSLRSLNDRGGGGGRCGRCGRFDSLRSLNDRGCRAVWTPLRSLNDRVGCAIPVVERGPQGRVETSLGAWFWSLSDARRAESKRGGPFRLASLAQRPGAGWAVWTGSL